MKVYLNGSLVDKERAVVSVFDHGFLYGDGVFEGIRSYNRCIFKLKEHIDRLYNSAKVIMLDITISKEEMEKAIIDTIKANNLDDGYIRVVVSRGEGDLGLDPRKCRKPSIIIIADAIALYSKQLYENGLEIITVPTTRNASTSLDPQIKSLNYLNNILGKIEAINAGYQEAIMMNTQGYVSECTGDNIFIFKGGVLTTVPSYIGVLPGITVSSVLDIARELGIPCQERPLTRYEIFTADEMFLTGTAAELIPVVKVDGRSIGDGKVGGTTKKLLEEFSKYIPKNGVRY